MKDGIKLLPSSFIYSSIHLELCEKLLRGVSTLEVRIIITLSMLTEVSGAVLYTCHALNNSIIASMVEVGTTFPFRDEKAKIQEG